MEYLCQKRWQADGGQGFGAMGKEVALGDDADGGGGVGDSLQ